MKKILIVVAIFFLFLSVQEIAKSATSYPSYFNNTQGLKYPEQLNLAAKANEAFKQKKYQEALNCYNEIIKHYPEIDRPYGSRGYIYMEQYQNYSQAISDFSMAIKYNNRASELFGYYYYRGLAKKRSGDYKGAISDFTATIANIEKIKSQESEIHASAYLNRAICYINEKKYEPAISDTTMSIKIEPKNPDSFLIRGMSKLVIYKEQQSSEGLKSALMDFGYAKEQFKQTSNDRGYQSAAKGYESALVLIGAIKK